MLHGLAALTHGLRVLVEPLLDCFENLLVLPARDAATVGVGAGQMSRVDSSRIAAFKGLEAAQTAGATAVIQPGGSLRDDEVIEAADKAGLAMVFTGMRHFRH